MTAGDQGTEGQRSRERECEGQGLRGSIRDSEAAKLPEGRGKLLRSRMKLGEGHVKLLEGRVMLLEG